MLEPNAAAIARFQDECCTAWHQRGVPTVTGDTFEARIASEHEANFRLWHIEDEVRREDIPDSAIAAHKRSIDQWNQQRNDRMERIDEVLAQLWPAAVAAEQVPANTESPGAACDRLSVLSLRWYHMKEQTQRQDVDDAHRRRCEQRLELVTRQRAALIQSLDVLFEELRVGRKRLIIFRQLKMYNDRTLNEALYSNQAKSTIKPPG